jgi:hypothetical protein
LPQKIISRPTTPCLSPLSWEKSVEQTSESLQRNTLTSPHPISSVTRPNNSNTLTQKIISRPTTPSLSPQHWDYSAEQMSASLQKNSVSSLYSEISANRPIDNSHLPQKTISRPTTPCLIPHPRDYPVEQTSASIQNKSISRPHPENSANRSSQINSTSSHYPENSAKYLANRSNNKSPLLQKSISRPTTPCISPYSWDYTQDQTSGSLQRNFMASPHPINSDIGTIETSPLPQKSISRPTTHCKSFHSTDCPAKQTSTSIQQISISSHYPKNSVKAPSNTPNNVCLLPQKIISRPTTPCFSSWEISDTDKTTEQIQRNYIANPHNYSSRQAIQTNNSNTQLSASTFLQDHSLVISNKSEPRRHQSKAAESEHDHHDTHIQENTNSSDYDELNNDCAVTWSYKPSCSLNKPAFENPRYIHTILNVS